MQFVSAVLDGWMFARFSFRTGQNLYGGPIHDPLDTHMESYFENIPSSLREYLPAVAKQIGASLIVIPVAAYVIFPAVDLGHLSAHLIVSGPFIAVILYGGYWLERTALPAHRRPRIGRWFLGGLLAFLALNGIMMTLWGQGVVYNFMWGLFAIESGGAAGLVIGIFEARAIEYEISAERDRIRREEAEHRSRQLEEFAQIVSHDLRNPLNVAWGRLKLAREERESDHLAAVEDALARMDQIIQDVLMLTWSGQGIDPEDLEVQPLREVAGVCWEHVDTAEARLRFEDDPTVQADGRRLQRLLENLFRNAVEHGGEGVTVRVGGLSKGFFVEDNGPGIPQENRDTVFEAGYSSGDEGTGLGLSIVRSIAEAHGWDISVVDGQEGGARFEFLRHNGQVH